MSCAICQKRRPRRSCPGVHGDICAICCGSEREVTVNCPLDCEYLQEAHKHEPSADIDPATMGNPDIRVTQEFLEGHAGLVLAMGQAFTGASAQNGALDSDVRDALVSLIQTYRALQNGVIYEGLPANPIAASLYRVAQETYALFRQEETQLSGMSRTRDNDLLRVLVFFERLVLDRNNGRPKCRAFLDMLRGFTMVPEPAVTAAPSLILP